MKGHKEHHARKARADGGRDDAAEDVKTKPERYNESRVESEAEERKHGGRAKRKHGGMAEKKHVGAVEGEAAKPRADHKPRKNGGRVGADKSPFSSARNGTAPKGREMDGSCD